MLSENAAEVLRFCSRRDLDKTSAVSKWLDALIAKFDLNPLRPVAKAELLPSEIDSTLELTIEHGTSSNDYSFSSMEEAVNFLASALRHSYVQRLRFGSDMRFYYIIILPTQWTTLIDAIRSGAVQRFAFEHVDLSALDVDAFLAVISCRGLRAFSSGQSVFPSGFGLDDLLRSSVANGLHELSFHVDEWRAPLSVSDNAVLEFFFRAEATPGEPSLFLLLAGTGVTDEFLAKFFERLRASPVRPGSFMFCGAVQQRGLSAYDRFLAPEEMQRSRTTYHFPSVGDDTSSAKLHFTRWTLA